MQQPIILPHFTNARCSGSHPAHKTVKNLKNGQSANPPAVDDK